MRQNGPLENILFEARINQDWHMQASERAALLHILRAVKPDVSIEIGTFMGGSLRPIASESRLVYTFDIDDRAFEGLPNVQFITGNSSETLPPVIEELNASDRELNFILIDGDHSETGVQKDIINCLRYKPKSRPTIIVMHDSSNPAVRKGIMEAPWSDNPHLQEVDMDLVPGVMFDREDLLGQIWGGFAIAVMTPEPRRGDVTIHAPFAYSHEAIVERSIYA